MLADLVPATVSAVEAFDDDTAAPLFDVEAAVVAKAVGKRRREFATSRACARTAFERLGIPAAPILPGPRGAPIWPAGVVGSMTHCDGYRAAAVALAGDVRTIGIDAEPDQELPDGVLDVIALDSESAMLRKLAAHPEVHWDRLLFSAKESVYKAWFPLTRRWLDFGEARIVIDPDAGMFVASVLVPPHFEFVGRWLADRGLVLTAIVA
jgi:4'-phosphopantetheinyl transferase EntD